LKRSLEGVIVGLRQVKEKETDTNNNLKKRKESKGLQDNYRHKVNLGKHQGDPILPRGKKKQDNLTIQTGGSRQVGPAPVEDEQEGRKCRLLYHGSPWSGRKKPSQHRVRGGKGNPIH